MGTRWKKFKREMKKNIAEINWNAFFIYLVVTALALAVMRSPVPKSFRIAAAWTFSIAQVGYSLRNRNKTEYSTYPLADWTYGVLFFLLGLAYTAAAVNDFHIAVICLLAIVFILIVGPLVGNLASLWYSEHPVSAILSYLGVTFSTILLFGLTYALLNAVVVVDNSSMDTTHYLYYSASTYYSNSADGLRPTNVGKWISVAEYAVSTIIHVIVLGVVVSEIAAWKKRWSRKLKNKYKK